LNISRLTEFKRELEICRETYENMVAEDKAAEKSIKKDFERDFEEHSDLIFKLYKKRYKASILYISYRENDKWNI
jgi:hypothetical protein